MSITDELREWTRRYAYFKADLMAIADRIDEQYRAALEKFAAMVDEPDEKRSAYYERFIEPTIEGPRKKDSAIIERIEELERRVSVITENVGWMLQFEERLEKRVSVLERKLNHRGER